MTAPPPPKPVLILDGGCGTSLEDIYSVSFSSAQTPLWSSHLLISDQSTLLALQTSFANAGADVLLTATYQASFEGFGRTPRLDAGENGAIGYSREEASEFMRSAVAMTRKAHVQRGNEYGTVALSLGAYGATTIPSAEYSGEYDEAHLVRAGLYDFHMDRMSVFTGDAKTWADVDVVAFETLPRVEEVWAVRRVMKSVKEQAGGKQAAEQKPFWISCVFPKEELKMPDGTSVEDLVKACLGNEEDGQELPTPYAIGLNCTKLHRLPALLEAFEAALAKFAHTNPPLLVLYPDGAANQVYNTTTQVWEDVPPTPATDGAKTWDQRMEDVVRGVVERDVWGGVIVGGCCKTTPDMIGALKKRLRDDELVAAQKQ